MSFQQKYGEGKPRLEIYEALQALNAQLDSTGEAYLIDLVEKIRTQMRREARGPVVYLNGGPVEATLRMWIEVDAAERPEPELITLRADDGSTFQIRANLLP